MFTGIIEAEGEVMDISDSGNNRVLTIGSSLAAQLKIDQSVAHNGVCLTVTETGPDSYQVCAVPETIERTTLGDWQKGTIINLERAMKPESRLDGHIVQGHVDAKAICVQIGNQDNNQVFRFAIPTDQIHLVIEKGSVCIDGTSFTCFNLVENEFDIAVIPYTYDHTAIRFLKTGDPVNIEFDVIGKYVQRFFSVYKPV